MYTFLANLPDDIVLRMINEGLVKFTNWEEAAKEVERIVGSRDKTFKQRREHIGIFDLGPPGNHEIVKEETCRTGEYLGKMFVSSARAGEM